LIEGMRERGFGRIVSISSINDQKGQIGQTNYAASKAGDIGFTKSLAQESAGRGITVNAVCCRRVRRLADLTCLASPHHSRISFALLGDDGLSPRCFLSHAAQPLTL